MLVVSKIIIRIILNELNPIKQMPKTHLKYRRFKYVYEEIPNRISQMTYKSIIVITNKLISFVKLVGNPSLNLVH